MLLAGSELKLNHVTLLMLISLRNHIASHFMLISLHAHPTSQSPRFTVTLFRGYLPSRTLPFTFTVRRGLTPLHMVTTLTRD